MITLLCLGFQAEAQDKILASGSGNPYIQLIDKQTGKVEWQHPLEKGEECNTVALTPEGNVLYSYKRGAKVVTWTHQVVWDYQTPDNSKGKVVWTLNDKKNIGRISAIHYLENMKLPDFKKEESL